MACRQPRPKSSTLIFWHLSRTERLKTLTWSHHAMGNSRGGLLSRRRLCLCCIGAAAGGWLTPREVFAEARGIVSLIKDSAAVSPILTHKLRNNITVLEGSGGSVAVLSGSDGKVLIDAGIAVSRPQLSKSLTD